MYSFSTTPGAANACIPAESASFVDANTNSPDVAFIVVGLIVAIVRMDDQK
jgi:hypothetical protein